MTKERPSLKKIPFDVHIPNLEGDGIASTITIQVEAYTDPETGEDVLTPEAVQLIEKTQARYMGLMSAEDIKALRHRLVLSQQQMSDLLQIGAKTYTRWESGRDMPSRSMNVMLCAIRDGQLGVNYLRALRNPGKAADWSAHSSFHDLDDAIFSKVPRQQGEFGFPRPALFREGHPELLAIWRHLWAEEGVVLECKGGGKSSTSGALIKAFLRHEAEEEQSDTPAAPRLPSGLTQRETFMNHRFHIPETEHGVSG